MLKPSRKSLSFLLTVLVAAALIAIQVQCRRLDTDKGATGDVVTRTSALSVLIGPTNHNLTYYQCASDGGSCAQGGRRYLAYGAGSTFAYAVSPASGTMSCTASAFGTTSVPGAACYVSSYTYSIVEGQSGTTTTPRHVAFGANGTFNFQTINGTFTCDTTTFGDPIPGVAKACYVGLLDHAFASNEYESFVAGSNTPVGYGAAGHYVFAIVSGTTACSTSTFGSDPAVGVVKACYTMPGYVVDEGSALPPSTINIVRYGSGLNGNFLAKPVLSSTCNNTTFGGDPDPSVGKHCYLSPSVLPELVPRAAAQAALTQAGGAMPTWEATPLVIPAGKANCNATNGTPNGALLLSSIPGNPQVWRGDLACVTSPTSPPCQQVGTNGLVQYNSTNWNAVSVPGKYLLLNQGNDNRLIRLSTGRLLFLGAGRLTDDTSPAHSCRTWANVNVDVPPAPPPVNCHDVFAVFSSDDCGSSWHFLSMLNSATDRPGLVFSGYDRPEFYADPWIKNRVYVATRAGDGSGPGGSQTIKTQILQSDDGAQTWQWKNELPLDSVPYLTSLPSGKLYVGTCCGNDAGGNPTRMMAFAFDPVANTVTTLPMPAGFPKVEGIAPLRVDNEGRGISRIGTFADGDYIRLHYTFKTGSDDGAVVGKFKVAGTQLQQIGSIELITAPSPGTSIAGLTVVESDRLDGVEDNQFSNPAMLYWYEVNSSPTSGDYGPGRARFKQLYGIGSAGFPEPLSVSAGTVSTTWPKFTDSYGDFSTGAFWRNAAGQPQFMALWTQQDAVGNTSLFVNTLGLQSGGQVAYYRVDENSGTAIGDASGNVRNATLVSGSWTPGHIGSAVLGSFRTNAALPVTAAVTVSAWVRRDGAGSGYPRILSWNGDGLELADVAAGNNLGVYTPSTGWSTTGPSFGSGWNHVAVTVGGGTITVYYNGAQVFAQTGSVALTGQTSLGIRSNNTESWNGAIDQVRIYDHVLTAAEVLALSQE